MQTPSRINIYTWDTKELLYSLPRMSYESGSYNLKGQDLSGMNLRRADLWGSLDGVNLTNADLTEADLRFCDLDGAIIKNTIFDRARFGTCHMISHMPGMVPNAVPEIARLMKACDMSREEVIQIIKVPTLKCISEPAAVKALQRLLSHLTKRLWELVEANWKIVDY